MPKVVLLGALVLAGVMGFDKFRCPPAKSPPTIAREKPHSLDWNDGTLAVWMAERTLHDRWGTREFSDVDTERAADDWIVAGQAGSKDGWRPFRLRISRPPKAHTLAVAWQ
jgi:hypothetical protein